METPKYHCDSCGEIVEIEKLSYTSSQEIIVYCGVGGYARAWWFVLTQILGYRDVKFYDGSAQDWTRDPEMPLKMYQWE